LISASLPDPAPKQMAGTIIKKGKSIGQEVKPCSIPKKSQPPTFSPQQLSAKLKVSAQCELGA